MFFITAKNKSFSFKLDKEEVDKTPKASEKSSKKKRKRKVT